MKGLGRWWSELPFLHTHGDMKSHLSQEPLHFPGCWQKPWFVGGELAGSEELGLAPKVLQNLWGSV